MATEVWFRSPRHYVRELLECNERNVIFDYGYIVKYRINPQDFMQLHYGSNKHAFRLLVCGEQGTAEYAPGVEDPLAVYPTWTYGDDEGLLESYLLNNVGDDEDICKIPGEKTETPVFGQEHRVIVQNFPDLNTGMGKQFVKFLQELQSDYPSAILHLHGAATFVLPVRMGFKSMDFEPRIPAAGGAYYLPTGSRVGKGQHREPSAPWLKVLGLKPAQMEEPRNRCICNIRAAAWAGANFNKDLRMITGVTGKVDISTPDADYEPLTSKRTKHMFGKVKPLPGDKFDCDTCSLAVACKFYRVGSVCTLPKSEPKELADFFGTRDSTTILDGLSLVIQRQAQRIQPAIEMEEATGELNPEVTKVMSKIFEQGTTLAKLVDPTLRNPKVQVNIGNNGGQTAITMANPKEFVMQAVRELEMQGFKREDITPKMIENVIRGSGGQVAEEPVEAEIVDE